jgi:hypothetical protein
MHSAIGSRWLRLHPSNVPLESAFSFFSNLLLEQCVLLACHIFFYFFSCPKSFLANTALRAAAPHRGRRRHIKKKKKKNFCKWFNLQFIHRQLNSCHNGVVRDVCLLGGDKFTYQFL